jgi:hypothetical protein
MLHHDVVTFFQAVGYRISSMPRKRVFCDFEIPQRRYRSTSRRSCATELRHCSALKALVHTQARSRHAHSQLSQFSHSILFLEASAKARRHNEKKGDARKRGRKQKLVLVNPSKWIDKRPTPDVSPTQTYSPQTRF